MKLFEPKTPLLLESGESIEDLKIAYHTFGQMKEDQSNVVWVFHALTANSNVMDWWSGLFGESDYFNPTEHFIVCANVIGSPYGSSAPKNNDFPFFSVRDTVKAHFMLAKELRINHIEIAIGGSFGGNQALEFAYAFKGSINNLILIASCSRESAWGIAIHESQRLALESDPTFGEYDGGNSGLKAARSLAILTYRTSDAFIATQTDNEEVVTDFKASSYIQYQGEKFSKRFNALSYYYLSKCLDQHNIGRGRGGEVNALQKIKIPTLVIGIKSDVLIPVKQQKYMNEHLPNSIYKEIDSEFGHDGFLVETQKLKEEIEAFIKTESLLKNIPKMQCKGEGASRILNVFAFGKGTVGSRFLDQLEQTSLETEEQRGLKIKLVGVADSKGAVFNSNGLIEWRDEINRYNCSNDPEVVIDKIKAACQTNVVIVDNTASEIVTNAYPQFIDAGFDLVASNKKANSSPFNFYDDLRNRLRKSGKKFLYETNVGAGLPVIDTLRQLKHSADNVREVRGVFSGSLSYMFNRFSEEDISFSEVLHAALEKGFTEPDPRQDLNGMDVARKLLILARELGVKAELEDVEVENLVPQELREIHSTEEFLSREFELNAHYTQRKSDLQRGYVYRYVGSLNINDARLKVSLEQFKNDSALGSVKQADAIFEMFTETYGEQPIVIQGAGAGAAVTARGVYSDVLRVGLAH